MGLDRGRTCPAAVAGLYSPQNPRARATGGQESSFMTAEHPRRIQPRWLLVESRSAATPPQPRHCRQLIP